MTGSLDGIVVVIVEDDPDALALLQFMIEYQGAVVVPAADAQSALTTLDRMKLDRMKPDVLVSDMSLPEREGRSLATEARSHGLLNGVPALLMTAHAMTSEQVQQAGFDAYLRKPVDPTVFCATVHALARPTSQPIA
jgi:CheY-like chemotaxis protein